MSISREELFLITWKRCTRRSKGAQEVTFIAESLPLSVCLSPSFKKIVLSFFFSYRFNLKKLTNEERKEKLIERLKNLNAAMEDDDEDD